jgi:diaminopimelate decarboxylase
LESGSGKWWQDHSGESSAFSVRDYADAIVPPLRDLGVRILVEPGRFLVGNAGVLLTRVRYIKKSGDKKFAIVDAGMNDLIRPALYQSYHEIVPVEEGRGDSPNRPIDIVGPVCESGDFFALDREMPEVREGDLLAIMSAGAYGFVMASNYNSRPLPAEALVGGDKVALIRKRQTWEDLTAGEV